MSPSLTTVRGLDYLNATPAQLHTLLAHSLETRRGMTVFTPNASIAAACCADETLRRTISRGDLLLPDGAGILLAAKRARTPLTSRLPGIEAGEVVLSLAAKNGYAVYFLGGEDGVAEAAAEHWRTVFPSLRVAGTHHGYFDPQGKQSETVLAKIAAGGASVVLVCMGFPRQEQWILQNRTRLPAVRLWMGLGGSFDVWSGRLRRAPALLRELRLEWLWRCLSEPSRFSGVLPMLRFVLSTRPATVHPQ